MAANAKSSLAGHREDQPGQICAIASTISIVKEITMLVLAAALISRISANHFAIPWKTQLVNRAAKRSSRNQFQLAGYYKSAVGDF
jgi:hypothetical protein